MMGKTGKQHKVTLTKDFYIGVFEVTQGQWEKVMKSNPAQFKNIGKGAPVEQVSWDDCQDFIKKLNIKSVQGFRLPTEAEWEYACRAGTEDERYGENLDELAWYEKNSGKSTHEVGKKKPNAWELYDTLGNVWEWCSDWSRDYPQEAEESPLGAKSGSSRILCGGCYLGTAGFCQSAYHLRHTPTPLSRSTGFRLVLSAGK